MIVVIINVIIVIVLIVVVFVKNRRINSVWVFFSLKVLSYFCNHYFLWPPDGDNWGHSLGEPGRELRNKLRPGNMEGFQGMLNKYQYPFENVVFEGGSNRLLPFCGAVRVKFDLWTLNFELGLLLFLSSFVLVFLFEVGKFMPACLLVSQSMIDNFH